MAASDAFYNGIVSELTSVFSELGASYAIRTIGVYDQDEMDVTTGASRGVVGLVADQQTVLQIAGEAGGTWTATKTLILTADAVPLPGEEVQVDGKWFPLSKVVPIKPADVVVIYMLDISK